MTYKSQFSSSLVSDALVDSVRTVIVKDVDVIKPIHEIALSPMPMIASLRIGRDRSPVGTRKKRSAEEIAAAKKAASDYKVQQAFDKLKPQPATKAKKVQHTYRIGIFGRNLKAKPEDFRTIPGKRARPDLQFEETQIDEGGIKPTDAALKKKYKQARRRTDDAWHEHESFTAYQQPEAYRIGKAKRRAELMAAGGRTRKLADRLKKRGLKEDNENLQELKINKRLRNPKLLAKVAAKKHDQSSYAFQGRYPVGGYGSLRSPEGKELIKNSKRRWRLHNKAVDAGVRKGPKASETNPWD